jgi:hypothetical protein
MTEILPHIFVGMYLLFYKFILISSRLYEEKKLHFHTIGISRTREKLPWQGFD